VDAAVPGAAAAQDAAAAAERKKRKRKRKTRYPKGFDPANPGPPPDPERWLPKWQRSDAKKLRKKLKGKDAGKGSQGAGKADESLDRSNVKGGWGDGLRRQDGPQAQGRAPGLLCRASADSV
jgi:signal recognition particle subunit SRP72